MSPTTFSRNVSTEFSYYKEPEDGGHARPVNIKKDKKLNKRNWQPGTVYDVRGSPVTHALDTTGIQYFNHESAVKDFSDNAIIKDTYVRTNFFLPLPLKLCFTAPGACLGTLAFALSQ
jgi:hypothetical protein